jgi:hypothetical protein
VLEGALPGAGAYVPNSVKVRLCRDRFSATATLGYRFTV